MIPVYSTTVLYNNTVHVVMVAWVEKVNMLVMKPVSGSASILE